MGPVENLDWIGRVSGLDVIRPICEHSTLVATFPRRQGRASDKSISPNLQS